MRPLTILQLIPALESGGAERCVADVSQALVDAGHRSIVASAGGRIADRIRAEGGQHVQLAAGRKSPLVLGVVPPLRRLLLHERVDVVDVHSRLPAWIMQLVLKTLPPRDRPALVTTVHGLNSPGFYSRVMLWADAVVAVSECVREHLQRMAAATDQRHVRVIRRGVDAAEFPRGWRPTAEWREAFEREFPELRGRLWLTLAGRLVRTKGHADLLRLTSALLREQIPVQAVVVGDMAGRSKYVAELRRMAGSLGVAEQLTFTGHRGDIRDVCAASAVVLALSHKPESFGLATAEALSLGIPVVGYFQGGTAELLAACFPEGAVSPGDELGLVSVVRRLLLKQAAAGDNSWSPAAFPFEKTLMRKQTLGLYEELASIRRNAPGTP
jgi:glycosyltransferase involved in cell wall biosynthesis